MGLLSFLFGRSDQHDPNRQLDRRGPRGKREGICPEWIRVVEEDLPLCGPAMIGDMYLDNVRDAAARARLKGGAR